MTKKLLLPLLLAMAGCQGGFQATAPGLSPTSMQAAPISATPASLPFKTVAVDPEGQGRFFKAGSSETVVLRSKAELDAFIARHPQAVEAPPAAPDPSASVGPPSGIPFGTPKPPYKPDPLPETLTRLDFDKYTAVAFFDGQVKVRSASRILGIKEQGEDFVASLRRWEDPAAGDAMDVNGRLHVIALPRLDRPIGFEAPSVVDGSVPWGAGIALGNQMVFQPQWPAVPNPDLSRDRIEQTARSWAQRSGTIDSLDLQLAPLASAKLPGQTHFTPDSLVWIARIKGVLGTGEPGGVPSPGGAGGTPATYTDMIEIISPEDGQVLTAATYGGQPGTPGMQYRLKPDGVLHLGENLRFEVTGKPVDGTLTLTISAATGTPVVRTIDFKDLATFGLPLDVDHVPFLTDAPLQSLSIAIEAYGARETRTVFVAHDPNTKDSPPMSIQGPGTAAEYDLQPGETPAAAFVRRIASQDWQGTALTYASRPSTLADVHAKGREGIDLDPATMVRVYEVRGTFPAFLVPAITSTTDADMVMAPEHLEIAVTETLPIRVVSLKAFPK